MSENGTASESRDLSDFFGSLFGAFKLDTKVQRAETEADWIMGLLPPKPAILDMGCGRGRLSLALSTRGASVTGLDINAKYLEIAKTRSASLGITVDWQHGDERTLDRVDELDAVVSAFTSFGYHTDDENEDVIRRVATALKPGGLFILELLNRDAPRILEERASVEDAEGGMRILKEYTFDWSTSRHTITFSYLDRDEVRAGGSLVVRMYSLHEIRGLLERSGFTVTSLTENLRGAPFRPSSDHIAIVARKKEV